MQSETGFPSSHQIKVLRRLKLAACAVLSADAGLLVTSFYRQGFSHIVANSNHTKCPGERVNSARDRSGSFTEGRHA